MIKCVFDILGVGAKARTRLQSEAVRVIRASRICSRLILGDKARGLLKLKTFEVSCHEKMKRLNFQIEWMNGKLNNKIRDLRNKIELKTRYVSFVVIYFNTQISERKEEFI